MSLFWMVTDKRGNEYRINVNQVVNIKMPDKNGRGAVVALSNGSYIELSTDPMRAELIKGVVYEASAVERDAIKRIGKPAPPIVYRHSDRNLSDAIGELGRIARELGRWRKGRSYGYLYGRKYRLGLSYTLKFAKAGLKRKAKDFVRWVTH